MEQDQAETELTALLIGKGEQVLSTTQRLLVVYANEKSQAMLAQAETTRQQGQQIMGSAVNAIREDLGVPSDIPLKFDPTDDGGIVVRWPLPAPVQPPEQAPRITLVKDAPTT